MNLDQHHRPHVTPREALVSRERIAPNQWELRPLRRRSRMKAGQFRYTLLGPHPLICPGPIRLFAAGISTQSNAILSCRKPNPICRKCTGTAAFPFFTLGVRQHTSGLKSKIHPRRHPFRCAQFSARWFSRGQGIHLRPYSRMAKIFTSSARKAAAENHIVFGSRQLRE